MDNRLFVLGSGGHAKVVVEAALERSPGRDVVLLDDVPEHRSRHVLGIPVSGGREMLCDADGAHVIVAVGDNQARHRLIDELTRQGHVLETVIHPAALVSASVTLGPGAFVSAGGVVIAEARAGRGAIINTGASIDHDCVLGEAVHIAPGVHLCGNVQVGDRTLIGVGACVRPGTTIAADVVVGAGAVVVADIREPGTYVGNPARKVS